MTDHTLTEQWIIDAEAMLSQLDPADPRFAAGFAEWQRRVREYEQEELRRGLIATSQAA